VAVVVDPTDGRRLVQGSIWHRIDIDWFKDNGRERRVGGDGGY
jgi:hypothetical protein